MRYFIALLTILTLSSGMFASGKDAPADPLDKKVDALFEKARSTGDQFEAAEAGKKLWDEEMNRVYQLLRKKLSPAAAEALQASQRKWIEWRDAEFAAINTYYDQFKGTMYGPMRVGEQMDIVRQRALDLKARLEGLKDFGDN